MIHIQIDPNSGVPVYRQVVEQIRRYIDSGLLAPGSPLPSVFSLAVMLAVNPTTIAKAYTELENEDVLEMKAKKWGRTVFLVSRVVLLPC
jgi:GntR family transcriptional regulator